LLGRLFDFFNRIQLDVTQEVQSSTLHNIALETRVEGTSLRLSKLITVSNRDEKHLTVCLDVENSLHKNRELYAQVEKEIKETMRRLLTESSEELEQLLVDQTKQRRYHLDEIKRQEARESVMVAYSVTTTGESVLLPMGVSLQPDFLPFPVCWVPANQPAVARVETVREVEEEMPLALSSAAHSSAAGAGLSRASVGGAASTFVITARDRQAQLSVSREAGGDAFEVASLTPGVEVKAVVVDKRDGTHEVSYRALAQPQPAQAQGGAGAGAEQKLSGLSLGVSLRGSPISGSPFAVQLGPTLWEAYDSSKLVVSDAGATLTKQGATSWNAAAVIPGHEYSVRITARADGYAMVGFFPRSGFNPNSSHYGRGKGGAFLYLSNGDAKSYSAGSCVYSGAQRAIAQGEVVTARLDTRSNTASFSVNGALYATVTGPACSADWVGVTDFYDQGLSLTLV
jgi:hypothetical protein